MEITKYDGDFTQDYDQDNGHEKYKTIHVIKLVRPAMDIKRSKVVSLPYKVKRSMCIY